MNTSEKILVMRAWVDGKTIQWREKRDLRWEEMDNKCPEPLWDWDSIDYRIKPEPMEIQVWMENGRPAALCTSPAPSHVPSRYTLKTFVEKV